MFIHIYVNIILMFVLYTSDEETFTAANSQGWHGRRASSHKGYSIDAPISKVVFISSYLCHHVFVLGDKSDTGGPREPAKLYNPGSW